MNLINLFVAILAFAGLALISCSSQEPQKKGAKAAGAASQHEGSGKNFFLNIPYDSLSKSTLKELKKRNSEWSCDDSQEVCRYTGNEKKFKIPLEESLCQAIAGPHMKTTPDGQGSCELLIEKSRTPATQSPETQTTAIKVLSWRGNFAKDSKVAMTILNQDDMEKKESYFQENGNCMTTSSSDGHEETTCPNGKKYVPLEKIGITHTLSDDEILTDHLILGEKYSISIGGLSSDNCNSSSGKVEGILESDTLVLANIQWMTTSMACVGGGGGPLPDGDPTEREPVILELVIPEGIFAQNSEITVKLYNQEELRQQANFANRTKNCAAEYNTETQEDVIRCPDGTIAEPLDIQGETQEILGRSLDTRHIAVGEDYEIIISGLSADRCNKTFVRQQNTLTDNIAVIQVPPSSGASTKKACTL